MRSRAGIVLAGVFFAVVALAACGDDEEETVATQTVARYCELARQIDDATVGTGAASQPGVFDGPPAAVAGALQPLGPVLGELETAAPDEVEAEAKTMAGALRAAQSGDLAGVKSPEFADAARKANDYRSRSCPDAGTSGEG